MSRMNGFGATDREAVRHIRLFSPENESNDREVDWPATIPFVIPAKARRKIRPRDVIPKLRIFNG